MPEWQNDVQQSIQHFTVYFTVHIMDTIPIVSLMNMHKTTDHDHHDHHYDHDHDHHHHHHYHHFTAITQGNLC